MKKPLIVVSTLALAACGGLGGSEDTTMKGGKWSNTMVIEKLEVPGASEQEAAMMQMMVGKENTSESCRSDEEMQKGFDDFAKGASENSQGCTTESMDVGNGKISGKIVCDAPDGTKAITAIDGEHTSDSFNMKVTTDVTDKSGEGQVVMKISGKRVGDCDA